MLAKLFCATLNGLEAEIIEVEISFSPGLPQVAIVGLADTSIKESKERVRACLKNSVLQFPIGRLTINLAPANIFKHGTQFDLPIALGILAASGQIEQDFREKLFLGELSLSGEIKSSRGVLAMVMQAKSQGFKQVFVSGINYAEACLIKDIEVIAVDSLENLIGYFKGMPLLSVKSAIEYEYEN